MKSRELSERLPRITCPWCGTADPECFTAVRPSDGRTLCLACFRWVYLTPALAPTERMRLMAEDWARLAYWNRP